MNSIIQIEKEIRDAHTFLREKNQTIPSDTLQFMLDAALEKLHRTFHISASENLLNVIRQIPQQPQVQYDLEKQLKELRIAANKLGLYDAADYLKLKEE